MPRGGRRPGAGRKPRVSELTRERTRLAEEVLRDGRTPLAYMLDVMRDPRVPAARRDAMAALAAPYVHPRLALQAVATYERRYSEMSPEELKAEAERVLTAARAVIDQAKAEEATMIEGEAERGDLLGGTE